MSRSLLVCAAMLIGLGLPLVGGRKQLSQRVAAVSIAGKLRVTNAGEIIAIAPTKSMITKPFVPTINAMGKFAVPGYNNMHVHVLDQENSSALLALMLTQGVTGFRRCLDPLSCWSSGETERCP
jgi:hypothetical protein